MKPYVKKPEAFEAAQWMGSNYHDFPSMVVRPCVQEPADGLCRFCGKPNYEHARALVQGFLQGSLVWEALHPGCWVVRNSDDEYSVLSDKEFHQKYREAP